MYTRLISYGVDVALMGVQIKYQQDIVNELDSRVETLKGLKDQMLLELDNSNGVSSSSVRG